MNFPPQKMKTMTLNMPEREFEFLEEMAARKDVSKTAIMRQAFRLYQTIDKRLCAGETMHFSGDNKKTEMMFIGDIGEIS